MSKNEILINIVIPFTIWLLGFIIDKIVTPFIPPKETILIWLKKFMVYLLLYFLPISYLIYSFIYDDMNKLFILKVTFFISLFNSALILNLIFPLLKKIADGLSVTAKNQTETLLLIGQLFNITKKNIVKTDDSIQDEKH